MKINKGFTLIELVISMLVVAVAMLGFAALMAYSSRSIHSGYTKSAGTNAVQGMVRIFQNNRVAIKEALDNSDNGTVVLARDDFDSKISDTDYPMLNDMIGRAFATVADMPGITQKADNSNCSAMKIQLVRTPLVTDNPELSVYEVEVHYVYQPLVDQSTKAAGVASTCPNDADLISAYCPFEQDRDTNYAELRVENNLVCDTLRTSL